jgi:hypothetical protein
MATRDLTSWSVAPLRSSFGAAYRCCQLVWVNGDQIGVTFLREPQKKAK